MDTLRLHYMSAARAVAHDYDALLIVLATRADTHLHPGRYQSILRRMATTVVLRLLLLPYIAISGRFLADESAVYRQIEATQNYSSISSTAAGLSVTALLCSLVPSWINSHVSSFRLFPSFPFRGTLTGYTTTLSQVLNNDFRNTVDADSMFYGISALIPNAHDFGIPDQVEVATSTIGHYLNGGDVDINVTGTTPVFAISYVHCNHDRNSLCKMSYRSWRRVITAAAHISRMAGYTHYMLWFDSVLRHRKQHLGFQNDVKYFSFGLLPYTIFHTLSDHDDNQISMTRFWPYVERGLATAVGKLLLADNNGFHNAVTMSRVSPSSAFRMMALVPSLYDGSLTLTYEPDADMLREVLVNALVGDWSTFESELTSTEPERNDTVDQQNIKRLTAELAWVTGYAQGKIFSGTTKSWRFRLSADQHCLDVIHDLTPGFNRPEVPKHCGLLLACADPQVEIRCILSQLPSENRIEGKRCISLGLRVPGFERLCPLPFALRAIEENEDDILVEVTLINVEEREIQEDTLEFSMLKVLLVQCKRMFD